MKDYLDGRSLMHPTSDGGWAIIEEPFYVSNGMNITVSKNTVPDPETKAFLEKFRKDISRSAPISEIGKCKANTLPKINKVIFNDPATIIIWADGTKTVVKCAEVDTYTKWAGFAFCVCKKIMGDSFHKEFKQWCGGDDIRCSDPGNQSKSTLFSFSDELTKVLNALSGGV